MAHKTLSGSVRRGIAHGLAAAALVVVALAGADGAAAQDPLGRPAADTIRLDTALEEMQSHLEVLIPAMRQLVLTMRDALPELEVDDVPSTGRNRPDAAALAQRAARFTRAYFDALLAEGFSREEALQIVSGAPIGRRR